MVADEQDVQRFSGALRARDGLSQTRLARQQRLMHDVAIGRLLQADSHPDRSQNACCQKAYRGADGDPPAPAETGGLGVI